MEGQGEPRLTTPGVMASRLRVPLHRVLYVLQTRTHIKPSARAGNLRLYDSKAIAQVRHELNAIDARRSSRKAESASLATSSKSGGRDE